MLEMPLWAGSIGGVGLRSVIADSNAPKFLRRNSTFLKFNTEIANYRVGNICFDRLRRPHALVVLKETFSPKIKNLNAVVRVVFPAEIP